ncbi:MAG: TetR/AcrR family transcriptional regulator [Desulfarculaceae bacterium]|nr:TetR/AcrR family transcriptional regulator [Desulfarculaceae bacterium]MCF8074130.1 TetR/AcrR family transcriptional regulator [Desulfarculaceae bacterium]MCF8103278.1 TetR/AcrR family transcriptional regulator [Desulfarculaceae bacterium]MCF8116864.1 TetR/AcrR family transcriptional regulator [Desulfarculaceae bacterium]
MPKQTLDKIKPAKREKLLSEAAKLFAERGYNQTDMAELASRAGVAKGSLYNYFESKQELYLYVARDGLRRSRQAVYGELDPEWDIFAQLEHIFRQGAAFARRHPEYLIIYLNVSSAGMDPFAAKMSREVEKYTADHLKAVLARDVGRGLVRPDLDIRQAAFWINSLYIIFVASLVSKHFALRMREYLEIKGRLSKAAVEDQLQRTVELIRRFLAPVEGAAPPVQERN